MNAKYSVPSLVALSAALLVTAGFGAVAAPKPILRSVIKPMPLNKPLQLNRHVAHHTDKPVVQGDMIVYPDGTRLRGGDHAGHPANINPDGTVIYPDGTRVTHDPRTGITYIDKPDGVETIAGSGVPTQANGVITFPDGMKVHAKGGTATINADGSITFPDGSSMTHNSVNGDTSFFSPGGKETYDNWRTGQHSGGGEFVKDQPEPAQSESHSESSTETSEAPEKDPPEKPEPEENDGPSHEGLVVNNDGPGGNDVSHQPGKGSFHLPVGGTNDAPNKPSGEAPSTPPKKPANGFGPGGRPFSESNTQNNPGNSVLRGVNILVDPDPNAMTGGQPKTTVIDPTGGHIG